ncbi:MAG: LysM peptidoglycan-binding domain-containing protein [bacterium]
MVKKKSSSTKFYFFLFSLIVALQIYHLLTPSQVVNSEDIPQIHTVKKGDTLWTISEQYLKDPFRWPQIWAKNKYVKNPHWIYPGDILKLKEELTFTQQEELSKQSEETQQEVEKKSRKKKKRKKSLVARKKKDISQNDIPSFVGGPARKKSIATEGIIESCGYIVPPSDITGNLIVDTEVEKINSSLYDIVFINTGVKEGILPNDEYTIFRDEGPVFHPLTKENLGNLIKIIGRLKIVKVLEEISVAIISKVFYEVNIHDQIKKYEGFTIPEKTVSGNRYLEGYIVANKEDKLTLSETDIVYIDAGEKDGIVVGNVFTIFKSWDVKLDKKGTRYYPYDNPIGNLTVLVVKKNTATGIITSSREPMQAGDMIRLK